MHDHDHGHGRNDDGPARDHGHPRNQERDCGPQEGGDQQGGGGGDTRFLQLEMSRVLASEAEAVTRQAIRELLLEMAKVRVRERFGDKLEAMANLAVDELLEDVESSLEIEARIQAHQERRQESRQRWDGIFAPSDSAAQARDDDRPSEKRAAARRRPKR